MYAKYEDKTKKNLLFNEVTKLQNKTLRLINFQPLNTSTDLPYYVKKN